MIGEYNIDFLVASLAVMLVVLYHFRKQKKLYSARTRGFTLFFFVGMADVALDIVTTILIVWDTPALVPLTRGMLTVFYLIQALFPYFIVYYTLTLRQSEPDRLRRDAVLWAVVPAVICLLILANLWGEYLFGFDDSGHYYKGVAYLLMYGYAVAYALAVLVLCAVCRRELGRRNIGVVVEFLVLEGICVIGQAISGTYLLTGLGLGLGLLVLYITIHNPNMYIDNLTGTFDKRQFLIWMREQFYRGGHVHVLAVGVPGMPGIGDSQGDALLETLALRLQDISQEARVFRISDRRFVLAVDNLAAYDACRRGLQKLSGLHLRLGEASTTASITVCGMVGSESLESVDVLLAYLDYMASLAARSGSSAIIQSDEHIMDGFLYQQEIDRFLDTAIEQDLFEVYYQPVYSMQTGAFVSLEALSRLRHPTLGYVPPEVFVMLAERSGRIARIGELQLRRVCSFLRTHQEIMQTVRSVKFNLSPAELLKSGHCQLLTDIICENGLPFSWFQFEITETVATEYRDSLLQAVDSFCRAGISLCLDDFGSGYANLNTVVRLPFSVIKLDRSLLNGIGTQQRAATLYRSLVGVLQGMGYQIIAEGAETKEEISLLKSWGVDTVQGYYFAHPVSETELLPLLASPPEKP